VISKAECFSAVPLSASHVDRKFYRWQSRQGSSAAKRRHDLSSCRYKGFVGMNRWVGLGVIADNIVNIGRAMEKQTAP
jgi:hypothetical protein